VQRDPQILRSPSSIGDGAGNRSMIADLETELRALSEAGAPTPEAPSRLLKKSVAGSVLA
jgi:hypothetical protein